MKTGLRKYPELEVIARRISDDALRAVHIQITPVKSEMPYKEQYTLEQVIKYLEAAV